MGSHGLKLNLLGLYHVPLLVLKLNFGPSSYFVSIFPQRSRFLRPSKRPQSVPPLVEGLDPDIPDQDQQADHKYYRNQQEKEHEDKSNFGRNKVYQGQTKMNGKLYDSNCHKY